MRAWRVLTLQRQLDAAKKHFDEQVSTYGETSLVSLVNHKGYEQPVKEAYEQTVREVSPSDIISLLPG